MTKQMCKPRLVFLFSVLVLTTMFQLSSVQGAQGSDGFLLYRYTGFSDDSDPRIVAGYYDMSQSSPYTAMKVQILHQYKPEFNALLYRNVRAVYPYWGDEYRLFRANNWILKDKWGNYIYSTRYGYRNYQLVDIGNPNYQQWVANWISYRIRMYRFDGVFADNSLSAWASELFWEASAQPINPRTGTYWTDREVRQALIALNRKVKQAIGSKLLICNGIYYGSRFYERYRDCVNVIQNSLMDGYMSEGWLNRGNNRWFTESEWLESLNLLIWTQVNGKVFVPCSCLERKLPGGCTKTQMAAYTVATVMLGITSSNVYLHLDHPSGGDEYQQMFDKANSLGPPSEDYHKVNGVYVRKFANGRVYVNPSGNTRNVDGITMLPHTGRIVTVPIPENLRPTPSYRTLQISQASYSIIAGSKSWSHITGSLYYLNYYPDGLKLPQSYSVYQKYTRITTSASCVGLIQVLSYDLYRPPSSWRQGPRVMTLSSVSPGTVIACFRNGIPYRHAAVFVRFTSGMTGFVVIDQNWRTSGSLSGCVGTHVLYRTGSGLLDADNYYVVHVPS